MGKHTAHHLQQVERELYDLLEQEKEHIMMAYNDAYVNAVFKGTRKPIEYYIAVDEVMKSNPIFVISKLEGKDGMHEAYLYWNKVKKEL